MRDELLVSADSHVVEPIEIWEKGVTGSLAQRAPRLLVEPGPPAKVLLWLDGLPAAPIAGFGGAGKPAEARVGDQWCGYDVIRAGAWSPVDRLRDQDLDGVSAEVLYPSLAMRMFSLPDPALQTACFRAYNDWIASFCAHDPRRLVGVGIVSLDDAGGAAKEARRCERLGLRGLMVGHDALLRALASPRDLDAFWAIAEASRMPVVLHILTGAEPTIAGPTSPAVQRYIALPRGAQDAIAALLLSGAFDRFPGLKIVSAENDVGWIPHFLDRLDRGVETFGCFDGANHPSKISDVFRRNVWSTFQSDRIGILLRHEIGLDRLLWGSDYPHLDSTWPRSREWIEEHMGSIDPLERRQIVSDNARDVFCIPAG